MARVLCDSAPFGMSRGNHILANSPRLEHRPAGAFSCNATCRSSAAQREPKSSLSCSRRGGSRGVRWQVNGPDAKGPPRGLILAASAEVTTSVADADAALLRQAARDKSVDSKEVTRALISLEKAFRKEPAPEDAEVLEKLGGSQSPGVLWRLIFTANGKMVPDKASGGYFPIQAVQRFDAAAMEIENGVFFGPVGYLTFQGPFSFKKGKLCFLFHTLTLKLGPFPEFQINISSDEEKARTPGEGRVGVKDPFFTWFYVEGDVIAGRGRGGGTALWARYNGPYK